MMRLKIGEKLIGEKYPSFIVAEAGLNHNGDLKTAKKMIDAAKNCGADAIKFQTYKATDLVIKNSPYYKIFKKSELRFEEFGELFDYANKRKIIFLSTPFSEESADFLENLEIPAYKISSGDLTYLEFLRFVARKKKPVIISTGMADIEEVRIAIKSIISEGNKKICIMHSSSGYPSPIKELNLNVIKLLKRKFPYIIGYSDNTPDHLVLPIAVTLGAKIIEKHFTLDKRMKVPDRNISCDPKQLSLIISDVRKIEGMLGNEEKKCQRSELKIRKLARRSFVATTDLEKGNRITKNEIKIIRPNLGISPTEYSKVLGSIVDRKIKKDEFITWKKLKKKK